MKKIIAVSVILGIGFLMFNLSQKEEKLNVSSSAPSEAPNVHEKISERQSLKQSKYQILISAKSLNTFPKECHSTLSDLAAMTAEEYKDLVLNKDAFITFFGHQCFEMLSKNPSFKELVTNSQCRIFEDKNNGMEGSCLTMMFILKAYFIADHTSGKTPEEMTSQELAANFVKMFFGIDKLTKKSFLDNLKIINTLQELHPHDPDVLEAYLGYIMIGKQVTGETSEDSRVDSLMQDTLGNSFKVDRLHVLKNVLKNDFDSAKQSLDKLYNLYPKEPELAYYYAAYYWKQANREMANKYLDKAINLGEACSYCTPALYKATKKRLANAKTGDDKLFSISIGLNFENL